MLRNFARTTARGLQRASQRRFLRIGDQAPNFSAATTSGDLDLYNWAGDKWVVLFSHPADYTPVCTTELGRLQSLLPEFEKRNVKVLGLSCDPIEDHEGWVQDIVEVTPCIDEISFPIIADEDRSVAALYDMLDQTNITNDGLPLTVRSVFVIGPDRQVKLMLTYPASTGRNFDELIRCIDSLQLTHDYKVATPVDWKHGDQCVVVPSISTDDAKKMFPKGINVVKPYLRMTPDPKNVGFYRS